MEIEAFINSIAIFDLLVLGALIGMFVLGYIQGVVRRLIGIASVTFSFFLAVTLRAPLGDFLARNWTHLPAEYSHMIGFGVIFTAAVVGLAIITQVTYKQVFLWPNAMVVEEIVGGFLGVVQGLLLLLAVIVIIDPYFRTTGTPAGGELPFIRGLHDAMTGSATLNVFRDVLIPGFFTLFGAFIPDAVRSAFPGGSS